MIPGFTIGIALGHTVSAIATDGAGAVVARADSEAAGSKAISETLNRIGVDRVDRVMVAGLHDVDPLQLPAEKVGILRIASPSSTSIAPLSGWPRHLARRVAGYVATVAGGHHFDGSPRCPLDTDSIARFAKECRRNKIRAVAVVGTNSQSAAGHEQRAAQIVTEIVGQRTNLVLGSTMSGIGLVERENTAVIEAALAQTTMRSVDEISAELNQGGVDTELHWVTGTGTLLSTAELVSHPLKLHRSLLASALNGVMHETDRANLIAIDARGDPVWVYTVSDGIPNQTPSGTRFFGIPTVVPGSTTSSVERPE